VGILLQLNICMPPPSYWLQRGIYPDQDAQDQDAADAPGFAMGPLGDTAMPQPLDVFSHLTKLQQLQELLVVLGPMLGSPGYGELTAEHVVQIEDGSAKHLSGV
jgi:hypothetical protein